MAKIAVNGPCPCGSGRKYKKCCRAADEARARELRASIPESSTAMSDAAPPVTRPLPPPEPLDEARDALERRFAGADVEARYAIVLEALDDPDLFDGEMVFNMLGPLHTDSAKREQRARFDGVLARVAEKRPAIY